MLEHAGAPLGGAALRASQLVAHRGAPLRRRLPTRLLLRPRLLPRLLLLPHLLRKPQRLGLLPQQLHLLIALPPQRALRV